MQRGLAASARTCRVQRTLAQRYGAALCGTHPSVPINSHQQPLGADQRNSPWHRPSEGILQGAPAEPQVQQLEEQATRSRYAGCQSPSASSVSQEDIEAVVAIIQSDAAICQRVACAVDGKTAERWAEAREAQGALGKDTGKAESVVRKPEAWQLWYLHVRTAVPFVGFGFFDNMIMLTVGGAIESTIGVAFGISTLAAAGMGQMVSDASGITLQGLIERFADKLGLPHPGLTREQSRLAFVKSFVLASRILGIVVGCCLGMFPLLLMPEKRARLVDQIAEALPAQRRREFVSLVQTREYQEGDAIMRCGDMSDFVFLVDKGQVDVVGRDAEGLPFHVCTMGPGQSFGKPQLHCPSHVDLIARDGGVVVQAIEKDDFIRITQQEGLQVFSNTQPAEHKVYFAAQGGRIVDAVPPASRGTGKTRMFASLSDQDKCKVLWRTGLAQALTFKGVPNEGKVRFFANLSEQQKHDALAEWHAEKFGHARSNTP